MAKNEKKGFFECLKVVPYSDLTDRPLLLAQLLFLYKRMGTLPEQPSEIYKRIVRLLLEEWDSQRQIKRADTIKITRGSGYAKFDVDKKAEFLAAMAYELTFSLDGKSFSEHILIQAYDSIYGRFGLPKNQATKVCREIQTHTGIIMAGPMDRYEFCHLSIQEYFCGNFLVRAPMETMGLKRLLNYTAPLAVAITLSSRPGNWLGSMILNEGISRFLDKKIVISLFSRLFLEKPFFEESEVLGIAILFLFDKFGNDRNSKEFELIENLLGLVGVRESLFQCLRWYKGIAEKKGASHLLEVEFNSNLNGFSYKVTPPMTGSFPKEEYEGYKKYLSRHPSLRGVFK